MRVSPRACWLLSALLLALPLEAGAVDLSPAPTVTLSLPEALRTAVENNLDLANAMLETAKAVKDRKIARRARVPEVLVAAGYTRLGLPETSTIPIPGYTPPDSEADLSLSATLPLYAGGRLTAAILQAERGLDVTREAERAARGDLLLEVAATYYELAAASRLVEVAGEALESSRRHLSDVNSLFQQGQTARVDIYRTELDLAERERDLAAAEAGVVRSGEHLSALLFPDSITEVRTAWEASGPEELKSPEEWLAVAEARSPEISSARRARELAGAKVAQARAERRPTVGLFGTYGTRDEEFSLDDEDRYWNAGLSLSLPLFRGGRTLLEIDRSEEAERQAVNGVVRTGRLVRRAIVEAHADTWLAVRQHAAAVKAIAAAEENLRVTRLKYRQGLISNIDVIDALLSLNRARFDRIQSLKNFHTGQARLMRMAGTIEELL